MTSANDNEQGEPVEFYFFKYTFENEGILTSRLGEQGTRDKLNRELASIYGPDGVTVTEFRTATETEVEEAQAALAERFGMAPDPVIN